MASSGRSKTQSLAFVSLFDTNTRLKITVIRVSENSSKQPIISYLKHDKARFYMEVPDQSSEFRSNERRCLLSKRGFFTRKIEEFWDWKVSTWENKREEGFAKDRKRRRMVADLWFYVQPGATNILFGRSFSLYSTLLDLDYTWALHIPPTFSFLPSSSWSSLVFIGGTCFTHSYSNLKFAKECM